jgi:perosamine synthetase
MIPYGKQSISEEDIAAVQRVLRSDWLTTGPNVNAFESEFSEFCNSKHAIAVNSGTAALHTAMDALKIGEEDEVIIPPMTFAATANCVVFQGGTPVFADCDPETLLIDPKKVEEKITTRTKAILAVDYTGHPCNYDTLHEISDKHGLFLVADACHSLGGDYKGKPVGSLADLTVFSFHPVKHITTGEGGMVTTDNPKYAQRMKCFRNHGITIDHRKREEQGSWFYEMTNLGYNYRITDFQCALGMSQLKKLPVWLTRRREIAARYDKAFTSIFGITPLILAPDILHAYHLYVVRVDEEVIGKDRGAIFRELKSRGLGVNVHYIPVHLHPFYQKRFGTGPGLCPVAERAYEEIITLPLFPGMTDDNVEQVIAIATEVVQGVR